MALIAVAAFTADALDSSRPAYDVEGGEAFEKVDARVRETHKDAPWLARITYVGPAGPSLLNMFDLQVDTDLDETSASDTATAIEICEAFEAAADESTGVVINGLERGPDKTLVDGTTVRRKPDPSKMAANDGPSCAKA